jgi:outer membrane phospholipase A
VKCVNLINALFYGFFSFDEGELFLEMSTSAKQRNWWQVVNERGNIGFVPSNYVEKLKVSVTVKFKNPAQSGKK